MYHYNSLYIIIYHYNSLYIIIIIHYISLYHYIIYHYYAIIVVIVVITCSPWCSSSSPRGVAAASQTEAPEATERRTTFRTDEEISAVSKTLKDRVNPGGLVKTQLIDLWKMVIFPVKMVIFPVKMVIFPVKMVIFPVKKVICHWTWPLMVDLPIKNGDLP